MEKISNKVLSANNRIGMPNPAAVYAQQQGYGYKIINDAQGNQSGIVTLPSGQQIDEWELFRNRISKQSRPILPPPYYRNEVASQTSRILSSPKTSTIPVINPALKNYRIYIFGHNYGIVINAKNKAEALKRFLTKKPMPKSIQKEIHLQEERLY